jgi:hypothetical protein
MLSMNGIFSIAPDLFPFVTSVNSVQALSFSKDSERVFHHLLDYDQLLKTN